MEGRKNRFPRESQGPHIAQSEKLLYSRHMMSSYEANSGLHTINLEITPVPPDNTVA